MIVVNSSVEYGTFQLGQFKPTDKLKDLIHQFLSEIRKEKSILFLVNERKILLQQTYKNLVLELRKYLQVDVEYVDDLYAGAFTNYLSKGYKDPQSVFVFLTKKYNRKQIRILEELKKTNLKVHLVALGINYQINSPNFNILKVQDIKSLYWFMYVLLNFTNTLDYNDFSERFKFTSKKFNFKK